MTAPAKATPTRLLARALNHARRVLAALHRPPAPAVSPVALVGAALCGALCGLFVAFMAFSLLHSV